MYAIEVKGNGSAYKERGIRTLELAKDALAAAGYALVVAGNNIIESTDTKIVLKYRDSVIELSIKEED